MGYKEFPYSPEQKGYGLVVTNPSSGVKALVGIFSSESAALYEGDARRKAKTAKSPRVVVWTEKEYDRYPYVYDIHFMFSEGRRAVPASEYRDAAGQPVDIKPVPDYNKRKFARVKFYSDIRSTIAEGRGQARLRAELQDHPANQVEIPPTIPLFTAQNNWAKDDYEKYVAFIRVNDRDVVIDSSITREKLIDDLFFGQVYSQYRPSVYYRAFRTAYGFESSSDDYSTPELLKESSRRMFAATMAVAGASNEAIQKIMGSAE